MSCQKNVPQLNNLCIRRLLYCQLGENQLKNIFGSPNYKKNLSFLRWNTKPQNPLFDDFCELT